MGMTGPIVRSSRTWRPVPMAEAMAEGDGKKRAGLTGAVLAAVKAAVKFVPRAPAVGTEEVADPEERPGVLYHRADAEIDHFRRHRLGQKLGHARVPRRADMLGFRIGGTDDDRHVGIGAFLVLADPGQEGHAVQAMAQSHRIRSTWNWMNMSQAISGSGVLWTVGAPNSLNTSVSSLRTRRCFSSTSMLSCPKS